MVKQFAFVPKKQKRSLSERVAKRSLDKDLMRKVVRKKRRRVTSGVPFLHGYATTEEFEGWLAANLAWWKRLAV